MNAYYRANPIGEMLVSDIAELPKIEQRDDRKTAETVARIASPYMDGQPVADFNMVRDILRTAPTRQAARGAERFRNMNPEHAPMPTLDGEPHKRRRGMVARFFTPKAMRDRYRGVMDRSTEQLIARLRKTGRERLDIMSFQLACDVTAEVLGLSDSPPESLSRHIRDTFDVMSTLNPRPKNKYIRPIAKLYYIARFYLLDIVPAMRRRKKNPQDDVISQLVAQNYPRQAIFMECLSYGSAGMMTTREFIVMVVWHLFTNDELREKWMTGDEATQFLILDEILRVDPIVTYLYRRAEGDFTTEDGRQVKAGELYTLNIREANLDTGITGPNPNAIDLERAKRERMQSSWLSFGDGPHRCPGAQLALHETRVFVDALMHVPGIRLAEPPEILWSGTTYELRNGYVECDKA